MAIFEQIINLNIKIKVFTVKIMASFIFKIDNNNDNIEINLIKILLQFDIVKFEILFLQIIIICLIFDQIIFIFENKYFLIYYNKNFEYFSSNLYYNF